MAKVAFPYRVKYMGRHYAPHEEIFVEDPQELLKEGAVLLCDVDKPVHEKQMEGQTNIFDEPTKEEKQAEKKTARKPSAKAKK